MRITLSHERAITLIGLCFTIMAGIVLLGLVFYVSVLIIQKIRTIEEQRERQLTTNTVEESSFRIEELPSPATWIIQPPQNAVVEEQPDGSLEIGIEDNQARAICQTVGTYSLQYSSNLLVGWVDAGGEPITGDSNAVRAIALDMLSAAAARPGAPPIGFLRIRKH